MKCRKRSPRVRSRPGAGPAAGRGLAAAKRGEKTRPGFAGRIAGGAPWRGFCWSSCLCSIRFIGIFAAPIALIALVGLLLWELFRTLSRRAMLKQAENAISPHRAAEALYRRALNLPVKGRDISRLYDVEQVDALSAELSGRIQGVAARHGIRVDTLSLRVDTVMGGLRKIDDTLSRIPLIVTITAGEAQGGCVEIILEYLAGFAFSDTGDCLLLDAGPRVLAEVSRDVTLPEERPFAVEFLPCPHCGFFASERFLRATGVPLPLVRRQRQTEGVTLTGPGREARCASRPGPTARPPGRKLHLRPGARRGGRFSA